MNKKSLLITIILILLPAISLAGSSNGWIYQNPYPTSNTLLAVKFVTPQKGWMVGEHGTIIYTGDGGDNWEYQESGTEEDLKSISLVNEKIGWAVGNGGVIIHTEDGGKTWIKQGDIKATFHIVFFINEKEGWVGGSEGTLLHTTDVGKSWIKHDIKAWADIAGISFSGANTGWVLSGGRVFRTTDGGKNWDSSELPSIGLPGGPFGRPVEHGWEGSIFFIDGKKGWATVGLSHVFYTEDGGKTWQARKVSNTVDRISFTDEKNGCTAGTSILCTEDGGKTWTERLGFKPDYSTGISLWGLSFVNQSVGWAVGKEGYGSGSCKIFKTEDGGKSWKVKSREYGSYYFFDSKMGWNIQYDNLGKASIVKTEDGGLSWKVQKTFESGADINFFFINPETGWAVGSEWGSAPSGDSKLLSLFILNTNNGGKTWATQLNEPAGKKWGFDDGLFGIVFINSNVGWVVGSKGLILHTKDGGKHWMYQKSGVKMHLQSIKFIDAEKGWIIGANVNEGSGSLVILHTDDGGKHWHIQWKKDGGWMWWSNLSSINKNNIWIVGDIDEYGGDSILVHSTDGGKTWSEKEFAELDLGRLFFLDNNSGIIFTGKGRMLITKDGGKTWDKQMTPIRRHPWHISEILK